jgi:hypothetical protein
MSAFATILLQKSKIQRCRKSREKWIFRKLYRCNAAVAPMRRSVVNFARNNEVVPHIASYETHQRSWKIAFVTQKRLLQQYRPNPDINCIDG